MTVQSSKSTQTLLIFQRKASSHQTSEPASLLLPAPQNTARTSRVSFPWFPPDLLHWQAGAAGRFKVLRLRRACGGDELAVLLHAAEDEREDGGDNRCFAECS